MIIIIDMIKVFSPFVKRESLPIQDEPEGDIDF